MRGWIALAAVAALGACGKSEGGEGSAARKTESSEAAGGDEARTNRSDDKKMRAALAEPCSFLPLDAVSKAAATTADKATPLAASGPDDVDAECQYSLAEGGNAAVAITYNHRFPGYFDADEIASRRDVAEGTATGGKKLETIGGVGDMAYYDPNREQLTVYRGSAEQVIFSASRRRGGDSREITIAMAEAAGY